jgi:hypothetical protein
MYRQPAFSQMRLSRLGYFLALAFCAGSTAAQQGGFAHPERAGLYAFRSQGGDMEQVGQGGEQQRQRGEGRRGRYVTVPDTSGYGALNDTSGNSGDNNRRAGRLSPEERRALRRQIDEAGHDLYSRRQ